MAYLCMKCVTCVCTPTHGLCWSCTSVSMWGSVSMNCHSSLMLGILTMPGGSSNGFPWSGQCCATLPATLYITLLLFCLHVADLLVPVSYFFLPPAATTPACLLPAQNSAWTLTCHHNSSCPLSIATVLLQLFGEAIMWSVTWCQLASK